MGLHKNLAEADLHELKGASTATSGQVPVANGTGSSVFSKIGFESIDTASIKNTNLMQMVIPLEAVTGVQNRYFPMLSDCVITRFAFTCSAAPSANTLINLQTSAGTAMAGLSILTTDTVPTLYSTTTIAGATISAGSLLRINHPNTGTTVGPSFIIIEYTLS